MTAKQLYEHVLTELNKVNAPALLLSDFNYLVNKGIQQYLNKRYTIYEIDQQTSDDLRVLASSASLSPVKCDKYQNSPSRRGTYEANLPNDYWHILNCTCIYKVLKNNRCDETDQYVEYGAKRLTADMWPTIMKNAYNKPKYSNPYFYIHNVNVSQDMPTNPLQFDEKGNLISGTDPYIVGTTTLAIFDITPEIVQIGQTGGSIRFSVDSKDENQNNLSYYLYNKGLEITNDESGIVINGPGKTSFIINVPENTSTKKIYYLTFIQNGTNKQKTITIVQEGTSTDKQVIFKLKTDITQWREDPTESFFQNGFQEIPADGSTCVIDIDMNGLRSFALYCPEKYDIDSIKDSLGIPVTDSFVGSGIIGRNGNIYYMRNRFKVNNSYTFTFKKNE